MYDGLPAEILIATKNEGKVAELRVLMRGLPIKLKYLAHFSDMPDVEESGITFEENAVLKAREYSRRTKMWSLADDSGLEVLALNGAPGVRSARYGGAEAPFSQKIALLLNELGESGVHARTARFSCVMALANNRSEIIYTATGTCPGRLADAPRGSGGFGYDPLFIPDGYDQTFGELPEEVKRKISHRAQASRILIRYLLHFSDN